MKPLRWESLRKKRQRLLFYRFIRLRLRNSGFALKQSRRERLISPHRITQSFPMFCAGFPTAAFFATGVFYTGSTEIILCPHLLSFRPKYGKIGRKRGSLDERGK